jgi:hypothetical protein
VGDAEASRERGRVAFVPVEELDHRLRLPKSPDALVDPGSVHRVEDENPAGDLDRVRRPFEESGLGPAEAALEVVAELEGQSPRNVW